MKKPLGIILSVSLAFSVLALPIFAADTTSGSTAPAPGAPAATTAPAAPAAPAKDAAPASVVPAGTQYTVVSGDAFWKIAAKHGLTIDALAKLNPQIKNINVIYPGQKVVVKAEAAAAVAPAAKKLYKGSGLISNYRPSKDQLNLTTADVLFDESGKIVDLQWDVMEITKTLFPGWPAEADKETYRATVDYIWKTKKEEGDHYNMKRAAISGKEWWEQIAVYEKHFVGMTVAEVDQWVQKYTMPPNAKPYKLAYLTHEKITPADKEAAEKAMANFTDAEKKMLIDVTTGATMSLEDDHSKFITALKEAWAAKKEIKY